MAMYQQLSVERQQVIDLAQVLSQQSLQQWQKAIEGLVALPTAIVCGAAATTLYAVGFVTRGFEAIQQQAGDTSQRISEYQREQQARGDRGQARTDEERRMQESVPRA